MKLLEVSAQSPTRQAAGAIETTMRDARRPRTALLVLTLLSLLCTLVTPGKAVAGEGPPRLYLPLVGRDIEFAWHWYATTTPAVIPAPNQVALALDDDGQVHLFWDVPFFQAPRFIYHTTAGVNTGEPWSPPARVAASRGESTLLHAPLPGPDGALHLLWHNDIEPDQQEQLLYAALRGGSWSEPEVVYLADGPLTGMVRATRSGRLTAVVVNGSGFSSEIYQITRLYQTAWTAPWLIPVTHADLFAVDAAWPDWTGGVRVYQDSSRSPMPPVIHYSRWQDGEFVARDLPIAARVYGRDASLDALDNLHIYWSAKTAVPGRNITALYHQCLAGGVQPLTAEIPSGERELVSYVGAVDTTGRFALAWRDETGQVWMGVWQGCARQLTKPVPLPPGTGWQPRAVALNTQPDAACLLLSQLGYPVQYAVVCGSE